VPKGRDCSGKQRRTALDRGPVIQCRIVGMAQLSVAALTQSLGLMGALIALWSASPLPTSLQQHM
jgi:hypothetical protein